MSARDPAIRRSLARAQAYSLLARAFGRPDAAFEAEVRDGRFGSALGDSLTALGCRELSTAGLDGGEAPLAGDFQRLFNPSVDGNCPPYETEYTGAHVFMRQQQLADVAGFYRAFGLRVAGSFHERPDHIAAELEFLAVVSLKEAQALARGERAHVRVCRRARARFLEEHLGRWLAPYAKQLAALAGDGFYPRAVALARDLVAWEAAEAGVKPQAVALRRATRAEPEELACPTPGGETNVRS